MAIFNYLVQPNLITVYTRTHTHTRAHTHTHTHTQFGIIKHSENDDPRSSPLLWHTRARARACTHVSTHARTHACTHTITHTHTHTHTHTITHIQGISFMPLPRSWSWITLSTWNFGIWVAAILNEGIVTTWNFKRMFVIKRLFKWAPTRLLVQFKIKTRFPEFRFCNSVHICNINELYF